MRLVIPFGIKHKTFCNKINVTAYLQTNIDKEIADFYHIPLNKESFDKLEIKDNLKNMKIMKYTGKNKKDKPNITKKIKIKYY